MTTLPPPARRLRGETGWERGDGYFFAGVGLQCARVAKVVLDVTIKFTFFIVRLAFEFAKYLLVGLT